MKIDKKLLRHVMQEVKKQNSLEDELALKNHGVGWDELEYDEKEEISIMAMDILASKIF